MFRVSNVFFLGKSRIYLIGIQVFFMVLGSVVVAEYDREWDSEEREDFVWREREAR